MATRLKETFTETRRSATPNRWSNDEVRVVSCPSHPCGNDKLIVSSHPSRSHSHGLTRSPRAIHILCRSYCIGVNLRVVVAFVISFCNDPNVCHVFIFCPVVSSNLYVISELVS